MVRIYCSVGSSLLIAALMIAMSQPALGKAKDESKASGKEPATTKVEKKTSEAKGPTLRMPPHFTTVIKDEQREKIASAYATYNAKLAKLRTEIDALMAERDKAIDAMLTDEQRETIAKLRADAKAKRSRTASK